MSSTDATTAAASKENVEAKGTNKNDKTKSSEKGVEEDSDKKEEKQPLSFEEMQMQRGLGRGVDITKPTPWLEKTAFQVREVNKDDLIVTDEGGLLKGYSDVVNSTTTIHNQVRAGVKAPDIPLNIGVDSEYSRTDCSSKHVVGLKVKNKTIAFRVDFNDLPKSWVSDVSKAKKQMQELKKAPVYPLDPEQGHSPDHEQADHPGPEQGHPTDSKRDDKAEKSFENRLCRWLTECLEHRGVSGAKDKLYDLFFEGQNRLIDNEAELNLLENDITNFIQHLGVTHYVSAIELGGLNFSILTEKEYESKVSASGSAALNSKLYGDIQASAKRTHHKKVKSSHTERKMIGRITIKKEVNSREEVKEEDEAVIGCQIRPISSLVRNPYIQQAVKASVKKYMETKISSKYIEY